MRRATSSPQEILTKRQLRVTIPRVKVLSLLMRTHTPLSIEDIAQRIRGIHIVTLYRMLERFAAEGIVYRADFREGKAHYEFQSHHHHHVTCTSCGKREEIKGCSATVPRIRAEGFASVTGHVLEFFGMCRVCTSHGKLVR